MTKNELVAIVKSQDFDRLKARNTYANEHSRVIYATGYTDAVRNVLRVLIRNGVCSDGTDDITNLLDQAGIKHGN